MSASALPYTQLQTDLGRTRWAEILARHVLARGLNLRQAVGKEPTGNEISIWRDRAEDKN
jgi:hypothetical protein